MDPGVASALWFIGTVGHFLLTARWVGRTNGTLSRDEQWFRTVLIGTAALSIVLHVIAVAGGLTLARVLVVLGAGHGFFVWRQAGRQPAADVFRTTDGVARFLEIAAILTIIAVVVSWTFIAVPTLEVSGTDAAHYHVPNAVNLALGSSPFDLPPTSHLYPMGSSTIAAWFILPVQTTLLTDLVMVLPFLLLMSSAGFVFRLLTAQSGLAWMTWPTLALFGTLLMRYASLMSADLLFAASTLALAAALVTPLLRHQVTSTDLWLVALSTGLLLGSKITGAAVAALLGLPAVVALAVQRFRRQSTPAAGRDRLTAAVWVGASAALVGAGGIWLLRNWWVWDSLFPGVTFADRTYASVLSDMANTASYDLWERARFYIDHWLGSWYLFVIACMLLVPLDAIAARLRGRSTPLLAPRVWCFIVAIVTGAVMTWALLGAPWTSLEWTEGLSLRYALPWCAILPLVAWIGVFPTSLPWYRRTPLALTGGLVIAGGSLAILATGIGPAFPPVPTMATLVVALLIWLVMRAATGVSKRASLVAAAVVLVASVGFGIWARGSNARGEAARAAAMSGPPGSVEDRIYAAALQSEQRDGRICDGGRRFFATTRFNLPLALQGVRLTNQVYYAARSVAVTASVRPSMGPCDYIFTNRNIMATQKGIDLHAALNGAAPLAVAADLIGVVLLVRR